MSVDKINQAVSDGSIFFFEDLLHPDLINVKNLIYKPSNFKCSQPIREIDKNGNSITPKFPVSEPGKHTIQLKGVMKTVDSTMLNISSSAFVKCSGKEKMKCKVLNI